jgi:hypothetical protein
MIRFNRIGLRSGAADVLFLGAPAQGRKLRDQILTLAHPGSTGSLANVKWITSKYQLVLWI